MLSGFLLTNQSNAQEKFRNTEQGFRATLPSGWDQVQGVRSATILKLALKNPQNEKARIVVVADEIPKGRIPSGFDIWNMSDDELRTAAKGNNLAGEKARVLDLGRGLIGIHHFVWYKTLRIAPDKKTVYEFVYEGIVGTKYYTIRLTSVGEKDWFEENQFSFSEFIRSIQIGKQNSSFSLPLDNSQSSSKVGNKEIVVVNKSDSFWTSLSKAVGEQFLKVLVAVVLFFYYCSSLEKNKKQMKARLSLFLSTQ